MYLIRNYLGVWTVVAGDERLWHRESNRSSINNTDTFYRVLCITYNIWLITVLITNLFSTFLAFHFWTRMPSYRRNEVKCWTLSTRCLPRESSKVIFSFYLLHPELLDTSKVHKFDLTIYCNGFGNPIFRSDCVNRWFTSHGTLRMSSFRIITTTSWSNFKTIKETWKNSPNILWMTKVHKLEFHCIIRLDSFI